MGCCNFFCENLPAPSTGSLSLRERVGVRAICIDATSSQQPSPGGCAATLSRRAREKTCFGSLFVGLFVLLASLVAVPVRSAEPQQLTHDGRLKQTPLFCAAAREIVFVEMNDPTLFQLRRLVLAAGTNEPLHPQATASEFEPAWSADGECYAFLRLKGVLTIGITIRDKTGADLGEIPAEPGFFGYRSPAVSPDRTRVAYAFPLGGAQQIYVAGLKGEGRRPLTDSRGINNWPHYSTDGLRIAFSSSRDGNYELYSMNADGTDQVRLTDSPYQDIRPRFSPDGRRMAFTSHRDGNPEVYVINSDGTSPRRITNHPERDDYPAWHPNSQQLVMVSEREGKSDLWLVDAGEE